MADSPLPDCNQDVFDNGTSVGLFVIPKETAEAICVGISAATGARVDWHYIAGRVHIKALPSQPQPPAAPLTPPDTASMYKALQDAYVVLCGYNANPAWRSFASEKAAQQIAGILHAQPDATTHKDAP